MEISSTFLKIAEKNREKYNGYKLFAETRQPIHLQHNQDMFYQNVPGIEDLYSEQKQTKQFFAGNRQYKFSPGTGNRNSVRRHAVGVPFGNRQYTVKFSLGHAIGVESGTMLYEFSSKTGNMS